MADGPKRVFDESHNLIQSFSRNATKEEKDAYKLCRSNQEKGVFRRQWFDGKLTNIKGTQSSKTKDTKTDRTDGLYMNFPQLVHDQGGLVDLPMATKAARNIALKCESRGPPYVLYNKWSEMLEYMNLKRSVSDVFERSHDKTVEGEFEADEGSMKLAHAEAERRGLSDDLPLSLLGQCGRPNTPDTPSAVGPEIGSLSEAPPTYTYI